MEAEILTTRESEIASLQMPELKCLLGMNDMLFVVDLFCLFFEYLKLDMVV